MSFLALTGSTSQLANRPLNCLTVFLALLALLIPNCLFAQVDPAINDVLVAAESTFTAMQEKDYPGIWQSLTEKTRSTIIDEIHAKSRGYSKEQIAFDFEVGGLIARSYWTGFLENFDPNLILKQSRWEIGFIRENEALIRLTYSRSQCPAELKLRLEGEKWKVGLVESFWGRKYLKPIYQFER